MKIRSYHMDQRRLRFRRLAVKWSFNTGPVCRRWDRSAILVDNRDPVEMEIRGRPPLTR